MRIRLTRSAVAITGGVLCLAAGTLVGVAVASPSAAPVLDGPTALTCTTDAPAAACPSLPAGEWFAPYVKASGSPCASDRVWTDVTLSVVSDAGEVVSASRVGCLPSAAPFATGTGFGWSDLFAEVSGQANA